MPIGAILRFGGNAVRDPQTGSLKVTGRARNENLDDSVNFTITITDELAQAVAASWRLLGLQIEMDDGAGLRVLKRGEIGGAVNLHASLDQIGRTLTFSRLLPDGSPLASNLLLGMRRIKATGYMGTSPATMQARLLFDGFLHSAVFNGSPPVVEITAQDASILYAERRLELDIAEGSGRTRLDIGTEILTSAAIPYGALDYGPNGGGIVRKAMSVGGDQNLLEWFRASLVPIGRRLRFNQAGQLEVGKFDETAAPVRRFNVGAIANLAITPPSTTEPNEVSMSGTAVQLVSEATSVTGDGSGGLASGMVVNNVVNLGDYAPQTATKVQDHITGSIADAIVPPAGRSPVVSAISTSTSIDIDTSGTVTVREIVDEYGFYAQRACQYHIVDAAGGLGWNTIFDVYLFSDGSARAVTVETYGRLSHKETVKTYRSGVLRSMTVTLGRWDPDVANPFNGVNWSNGTNVLVTNTREQWQAGGSPGGRDAYFDLVSQTFTTYTVASDGLHLESVFETVNQFVGVAGTAFSGYVYQNTGDPSTGQLAETLQSSSHAEQIANMEKAVMNPQALMAISVDKVRQGLTTRIIAQQQNDFCENLAELHTAAFFGLRDIAKTQIGFDSPVDLTSQDGSVFTLPIPRIGSGDAPIVVGEWDLQIDGGMMVNSQHITGWLYPPNLRSV